MRQEDYVKAVTNFYLTMTSGLGNLGDTFTRSFYQLEKGLHGYSAAAEAALARATTFNDFSNGDAVTALGEEAKATDAADAASRGAGSEETSGGVELRGDSAIVREMMRDDGGREGGGREGAHEPLLGRDAPISPEPTGSAMRL